MPESPVTAATSDCFEFVALNEARNYRAALLREFAPYLRGRVIEIGAGIGQFTASLIHLPTVEQLVVFEPNPAFCRVLRRDFPNLSMVQGTSQAWRENGTGDAVVSLNVLEHIADDAGELQRYGGWLKPGQGALCLFVPARPEIYSPLDRDFGHHRRYTRPELRGKLERAGFRCLRLDYFNWVGYFAWWFSFCLRKQRRFDPRAVRHYDRFIFPLVYWLESHVAAPPWGQSLIVIAKTA
jgi:SAM-dependent methyltransferase